MLNINKWL